MENAFGILAARWGIYNTTINLEPINVENAVKATCVLHNFLCIETNVAANNCPAGYSDSVTHLAMCVKAGGGVNLQWGLQCRPPMREFVSMCRKFHVCPSIAHSSCHDYWQSSHTARDFITP